MILKIEHAIFRRIINNNDLDLDNILQDEKCY